MYTSFFNAILHNCGVLAVGFILAFTGRGLDVLLQIPVFGNSIIFLFGIILLTIGFAIRVWAAYYFYRRSMKVISLEPQNTLITSGPFKYSRNPLYLGGNVFIFLGAAFVLGSLCAILLTIVGLFLTDHMIAREEEQLERKFGATWNAYAKHVRRWV